MCVEPVWTRGRQSPLRPLAAGRHRRHGRCLHDRMTYSNWDHPSEPCPECLGIWGMIWAATAHWGMIWAATAPQAYTCQHKCYLVS